MPVTSKDFKLMNSTPEFEQQIDRAFDYFRAKYPGIDDALHAAADMGYAIYRNLDGNPLIPIRDYRGADFFGKIDGQQAIAWNPLSAMLVAKDGHITGMQSPAMGLLHELLGHGLDINIDANRLTELNTPYENGAEHLAVNMESIFGVIFGEPERDNHGGKLMWVDDVTTHTVMGDNGELTLVRIGADGKDEYGPQIDYTSSGWQHLESAFKTIIHASVVQQHGGVTMEDLIDALKIVAAQSGGSVNYDEHGRPFINPGLPVPGPNDPVIIIDPHGDGDTGHGDAGAWESGWPTNNDSGNGTTGGGAWESGWDNDGITDGGEGGNAWESGDAGCVAIASFLPDGRRAGDIGVGDSMELADQHTLERGSGVVSYSQEKYAFGYRIVTESGAALVCSDTAPIPVRERGLMTPVLLLGEEVAVRHDKDGIVTVRWEKVTSVVEVGHIAVQHITVGNKCFWAGETKGAYILHHNVKDAGGGGDGNDAGDGWCWWGPQEDRTRIPADTLPTAHHDPAQLVGVAPGIDGGMS